MVKPIFVSVLKAFKQKTFIFFYHKFQSAPRTQLQHELRSLGSLWTSIMLHFDHSSANMSLLASPTHTLWRSSQKNRHGQSNSSLELIFNFHQSKHAPQEEGHWYGCGLWHLWASSACAR